MNMYGTNTHIRVMFRSLIQVRQEKIEIHRFETKLSLHGRYNELQRAGFH